MESFQGSKLKKLTQRDYMSQLLLDHSLKPTLNSAKHSKTLYCICLIKTVALNKE